MTAYGELTTAVEAVRNGAFDYLTKPFDAKVARRVLERALPAVGTAVRRGVANRRGRCLDHGGPLGPDAGSLQADRAGGGLGGVRPRAGREWDGQGTGRPGDPSLQPPSRAALRRRQCRLAQPDARRKRTVRPCPRRVSPAPINPARASWNKPTAARSSLTKWPIFRCRFRSSCFGRWSTARFCRSGPRSRSRSICGSFRRRTRTFAAAWPTGNSGTICIFGW